MRARPRLVRMGHAAQNALELVRLGRLGERRDTPYQVVHRGPHFRLRRYEAGAAWSAPRPVVVLVPPLMLTAEIYDVAPDLSAVATLLAGGVDPWVVDFGAPEREEGGLQRTLDDHVRAVAESVRFARRATGRDVHLAGYSQGGMFAYQSAAYLRSEGLASVIAFGSPVDIHRALPLVSSDVAARMLKAARPFLDAAVKRIEGLPGVLTSTGFKVLSARKEAAQLVDFVRKLHDRKALERREQRRRFLGGEGFVAWPGPALSKFLDEFVVHNRLISGGFVIDGRTVTLGDITCPILCFVGTRDEIARAPAVRAIRRAAPRAEVHEVPLPAGHFGLVVGGTAERSTWPTVIEWLRHRDGLGPPPTIFATPALDALDEEAIENERLVASFDLELVSDAAVASIASAWKRLGHAYLDAGDAIDSLRYQLPRLVTLRRLRDDDRASAGRSLAEQARAIGERTFFLWRGRAFTYKDADRRVTNVARGLWASGVRPGARVGVVMEGRPSSLSIVTALSRLGAVAVVASPRLDPPTLRRALELEPLGAVVADPENAAHARAAFDRDVLVLGGGGPKRALPEGVIDLEAIDPDTIALPRDLELDAGRASDLALVLVSASPFGALRAAHVTNRRWALSALGAAAACTLTSADTVYCATPLHHASGLLVAVGSALVAGARLALATRFEPATFWSEVHAYGATVTYYAGDMCRALVDAAPVHGERTSSLRLFAGSGLRADVWRRMVERFGVGVLELYASTEATFVLANAAGDKIGSVGRPLPGSAEHALARWDFEREELAGVGRGRLERTRVGEPGVLLVRLDPRWASGPRVVRSAFDAGDAWLVTGDLLRADADGDHELVDRVSDVIRAPGGPIFPRALEDVLYAVPGVRVASVYGRREGDHDELEVRVVVADPRAFDHARTIDALTSAIGGRAPVPPIVVVDALPMSEGYRPWKPSRAR